MSSAVLYLAIVAVWAVVLVPMWLHRDGSRLLTKRTPEEGEEPTADPSPAPAPAPTPRRRQSRAAIIARRRRRTAGLTLLLATTIGVVVPGLAPWWITLPPVALLAGHLALLRVAVRMDAASRHQRRARAREARREEPQAEIIELAAPTEVFDQYADDRHAVGE
ncbi:hypothetical protein Acsp03_22930 [Actinomadura sp. NBRC 104412]|uniref:hypothetical protein n=1 Tax=Actinomadura sp. NBRC 104412 TaxID=3032203 RepID=UPI0024A6087B|nr:hypothetical protein [Actinomadura sp. NBRC 104412]GLZ04827.1 hypothetical protein Acsp03_22930 [Actinomadura sp. NBRC 104412]